MIRLLLGLKIAVSGVRFSALAPHDKAVIREGHCRSMASIISLPTMGATNRSRRAAPLLRRADGVTCLPRPASADCSPLSSASAPDPCGQTYCASLYPGARPTHHITAPSFDKKRDASAALPMLRQRIRPHRRKTLHSFYNAPTGISYLPAILLSATRRAHTA